MAHNHNVAMHMQAWALHVNQHGRMRRARASHVRMSACMRTYRQVRVRTRIERLCIGIRLKVLSRASRLQATKGILTHTRVYISHLAW